MVVYSCIKPFLLDLKYGSVLNNILNWHQRRFIIILYTNWFVACTTVLY